MNTGFAPDAAPHFIEISHRSGELQSRMRIESLPIAVGRALDNDVIVDDPYVAAHHLRIELDGENSERYKVVDLGSKNGLYANGKRLQEASLKCGQTLRFGHLLLRIRDARAPVAEEKRDHSDRGAFSLTAAVTLLIVNTVIAALIVPFQQFSDIGPQVWLSTLLIPIGILLAWSTIWAGLSKLTVGRPHFANHLAIAGWAVLLMEVLEDILQIAGFAFGVPRLQAGIPLMYAGASALMLAGHLSLVQTRWPRLNLPASAALASLPLVVFMMNNWDNHRLLLPSAYSEILYDGALRVVPPSSLEDALKSMQALRNDADKVKNSVDEHDVVLSE